jgi:Arc/MetJ-type ribon-helix-helix transcriptional regulator
MAAKRNKDSIHATVSPYLKKQAEALVETEEFSSMSDLVSIALAEFIGKYTRDQKEKEHECEGNTPAPSSADASYLQTKEGRAFVKSVIMEAFTPTDAAYMKESKKNGNRPIIVDDIIE